MNTKEREEKRKWDEEHNEKGSEKGMKEMKKREGEQKEDKTHKEKRRGA